MKLDELLKPQKTIRFWENEWSGSTYVSVADCPTQEEALAFYHELVGQEWENAYLDEVVVKIIPCCDHDVEECDRRPGEECRNAIARKVWAFEV